MKTFGLSDITGSISSAAGYCILWAIMTMPDASAPVRTLLARAIDYAGLFPPAALSIEDTVDRYARYRGASDRWALGRLVVPAARLAELARVRAGRGLSAEPWELAVTLGQDWEADRRALDAFGGTDGAEVRAVEGRLTDESTVAALAGFASADVVAYGEVTPGDQAARVLAATRAAGLAAKLRMGGVTADLIPASARVAEFLAAVASTGISFKATAGLHHPLRGDFPLTYRPDSPCATMYGYLNLVVAAMVAGAGGDGSEVRAALEERAVGAISFDDRSLIWRGRSFDEATLAGFRRWFHGFGSCSFREPIDELSPILSS